ncbi:TPA: hypothetical protein N0F65_000793 [Lagenidium giganteum]|uniref:RNase H type-1 domain-containing protein n=1 Tax=Lagenidium giganteum TaxID=4803 RepID=A0AAV2ZQZ2_9STRA|nr:TPA: hypothetical protein N0F65_000793 [Lagenidium giganteum]
MGLTACRARGVRRLTVIGDSQFIVQAMKLPRRPKNATLGEMFQVAHQLRLIFDQCSWQHHYRAFNRVADGLANWALDNQRTQQFDRANAIPESILQHLGTDLWGQKAFFGDEDVR